MAGITYAFQRLKLLLVSFSETGRAKGGTITERLEEELAIDVFEEWL
jgi:hypothetical protein